MGHQVTLAARERGAIIRPLGDVVVLMPPLSIGTDELTRLVEITAAAIEDATGAPSTPLDTSDIAPESPVAGAARQAHRPAGIPQAGRLERDRRGGHNSTLAKAR